MRSTDTTRPPTRRTKAQRSAAPSSRKLWSLLAKWKLLPVRERVRRNQASLDEAAATWDELVATPARAGRTKTRDLFFMHIPKAGGSTLDNIIPQNYDINSVIHVNAPQFHRNPTAVFKDGFLAPVLLGHFRFRDPIYQLVDGPLVNMTMFREPVGRAISYYNFLLAAPRHKRHDLVAGSQGLEAFLDDPENLECRNGQVQRVAGFLDRKSVRDPKLMREALSIAKENITRRFSIFGLTEAYPEFLIMCHRLLGWQNLYYRRRKVTKAGENSIRRQDVSDAVIDRIREQNALDVEFYDFLRELNEERCAQLGITDEHVDRFNAANAAYGELTTQTY